MSAVVACLGNTAAAEPVLRAALALAPLLGAEVRAVHVSREGEVTAESVASAHDVPLQSLTGEVAEALVRAASATDVVAVVMGARARPTGPRTPSRLVWELARRLEVPLLVVPPEAQVPERFTKVLMAMKGTPRNARHLRSTIELAAQTDLELVALHVDDEGSIPTFSDQLHYDVEVYAKEFLERYVPGLTEVRLELRIGDPAEQILATAESTGAHAIASGFSPSRPRRSDVVVSLIERSHVPVLLATLR